MSASSPKIYPWNSENPIWNYDSQYFISVPHQGQSDSKMKDVNGKSFRNPSFPHTVVDTFLGKTKLMFDKYIIFMKPNEFREIHTSAQLKGYKPEDKFLVVFYHLNLRQIVNRLRKNPKVNIDTMEDLKKLMAKPAEYTGRKVIIELEKTTPIASPRRS